MKRMIPKITTILAVVGLCASMNVQATLAPFSGIGSDGELTLNDVGVVGWSWGVTGQGQGNLTYEQQVAIELIQKGPNQTVYGNYGNPAHPTYGIILQTSATSYSGIQLKDETIGQFVDGKAVTGNYDFAIAKYDGDNAGYVLFYLGGTGVALPSSPYSIWGKEPGQYQISNFTLFNKHIDDPKPTVPEPTTVLAGLLMLLPLGASAFRIIRKKS